jgi:uncharacterized protein
MTAPRFERDRPAPGPLVQGFSGRGFSIGGRVYDGVLLTPDSVSAWAAPALADLDASDIELLLGLDPAAEFLILGTGATMAFPPRAFVAALEARGLGVEAMDSRAAARTWGVLRAEGRHIVAALMPL